MRFDRDPGAVIADLVRTSGEALADASWIPTAFACEQASGDVRILLTGDGGDEVLLGYRRHAAAGLAARWIPRALRPACARLSPFAPTSGTARFLRGLARGHTAGFLGAVESLVPPETLQSALVPDLLGDPDPLTVAFMLEQGSAPDGAATAGRLDLRVYLPGDLLPKADRASMRHGVEIRSPFLDLTLVAQMLAVPGDRRLPGLRTTGLLRDLLRKHVPAAVVQGRKRGFGVPLLSWLRRGPYGTFADTLLGDLTAPFEGLLAGGTARPLLLRLRAGEDELAPLVHACVVLAIWHDAFMRGS